MQKLLTKRKTKTRTRKHTPRSGSVPRSSTKNNPPHVYLNTWGFIRVPAEYVKKLPFKANENLDLVIKGKALVITKKLGSPTTLKILAKKIDKALSGKVTVGTEKDMKTCEKHKIDYSDFCPMCKTLEKAEENEKKMKAKEAASA